MTGHIDSTQNDETEYKKLADEEATATIIINKILKIKGGH